MDAGTTDDNIPEKVIQLPGSQRKLALICGVSNPDMSPKSTIRDKDCDVVIDSECHTTTGELLCEKYIARDENGREDIEGRIGAARET